MPRWPRWFANFPHRAGRCGRERRRRRRPRWPRSDAPPSTPATGGFEEERARACPCAWAGAPARASGTRAGRRGSGPRSPVWSLGDPGASLGHPSSQSQKRIRGWSPPTPARPKRSLEPGTREHRAAQTWPGSSTKSPRVPSAARVCPLAPEGRKACSWRTRVRGLGMTAGPPQPSSRPTETLRRVAGRGGLVGALVWL